MSRLLFPRQPWFKDDGTPAALGTIYFGNPDTDPVDQGSNAKAPYTDRALSSASASEITLTVGGKLPNPLYLNGNYSITVKDADGVQIDAIASFNGESTDTIGDDSDYGGASLTATLNSIKSATDGLSSTAIVNIVYPVNSIYQSYVSTNPATTFGVGTWVRIASGRVLAGVGDGTDSNAVEKTLSLGNNAGSYEHVLTEAELAAHGHDHKDRYFNETDYAPATNKELMPVGYNGGAGSNGIDLTNTTFYYYDDTTDDAGSNSAHENMPPTTAVYVWRRTA